MESNKKVWKIIQEKEHPFYYHISHYLWILLFCCAVEPWQLGWDLGREAGMSKAGGSWAGGREWSSFSPAPGRAVWEGQERAGRSSSLFLLSPSPHLISHISYKSGNSFMLDRKKGEKGKREKNQGSKATYSLRGLHLDPWILLS